MPSPSAEWHGLVAGRRPWRPRLVLTAPVGPSPRGGSGAFLGIASDRRRYWIKALNNGQGPKVPTTEQIVGRVGRLIGAPTCEVNAILIPRSLAGWEFRPGRPLERGIAHASLAVGDTVEEIRDLRHRSEDMNAIRHVGYIALYDWCWGGDVQGLVELTADKRFHSHDHGWFLPPTGPDWDVASLRNNADAAHPYPGDVAGVDLLAVAAVAGALEGITRETLAIALASIPRVWPVDDAELEEVGAFLECRAPAVAARLRAQFGVAP